MDLDKQKKRINRAICGIKGAPDARAGQVQAVQRLVYQHDDIVLVAATGYGKSAVLYTVSALTERIRVQIVPLTKLGKNEREDITRNVPDLKPVWIDADTHLKNRNA
ncbi:hypothetical protein B0T24DRAFT_683666 [Lasiosphaeria ovina]|uniref:DEAD/DEAH box helicase domain-containing protein n=1 Tax=Lasiosphaeria ovina TaxID=92902 RepID=A0AAE0JVB5_9PEZI|nr:hypothetical protein B0T24DRAFT_683666 [Lasiosphaeria ovina]